MSIEPTSRPMGDARQHCELRSFAHGEWVKTTRGKRPVARLRPGDRIPGSGTGADMPVQWLAMSRSGPDGRITIRVMLGAQERSRIGAELPLGGHVSPETGRLVRCPGGAGLGGIARTPH